MFSKIFTAALAVSLLVIATPVLAQDGTMARTFSFAPLPGHAAELDKAMTTHAKWRKENNDPWGWGIYQQAAGDDLLSWYVRSGNHSWADFDAYDSSEFGQNAFEHWNEHVAKHVGSMTSGVTEGIAELSNWPEDPSSLTMFNVINYEVRQGMAQDFRRAAKAITDILLAGGFDQTWGIGENQTGPQPGFYLVLAEDNWAGFAPPEQTVFDVLAGATDPETATALFADYSAAIKKSRSTFYRLNTELSYSAAE